MVYQRQIPDNDSSAELRETRVRELPFKIDVHKIESAFEITNLQVGDFANIRLSDLVALKLESVSIGVIIALVSEAEIKFKAETKSESWLSKSVIEEILSENFEIINFENHYLHEIIETLYRMPRSEIQKIIRSIELNGIRYKKNIFYDVDLPLHLSGIPNKILRAISSQGVSSLRDFKIMRVSLYANYEDILKNILKFYKINLNSAGREEQKEVDPWGNLNLAFNTQPGLLGSIMRAGTFPNEHSLAKFLIANKDDIPAIKSKIKFARDSDISKLLQFANKLLNIEG